jgi:hypothetical protein
MEPFVPVLAAIVTASSAVVVALIHKFRKENHKDHARVMDVLDRVSNTVDRVEGKVDSHLQWHIEETGSGRVPRRGKTRASKATKLK